MSIDRASSQVNAVAVLAPPSAPGARGTIVGASIHPPAGAQGSTAGRDWLSSPWARGNATVESRHALESDYCYRPFAGLFAHPPGVPSLNDRSFQDEHRHRAKNLCEPPHMQTKLFTHQSFFYLRSVPCASPDPRGPVATTRESWSRPQSRRRYNAAVSQSAYS
jgi:hypothetical protein